MELDKVSEKHNTFLPTTLYTSLALRSLLCCSDLLSLEEPDMAEKDTAQEHKRADCRTFSCSRISLAANTPILIYVCVLPSPSLYSSSCVLSGWFWQWLGCLDPGDAVPCGWAAVGWRRSPAQAWGNGWSSHSLWKSLRSPALMDSQLSTVGSNMVSRLRNISRDTHWCANLFITFWDTFLCYAIMHYLWICRFQRTKIWDF